MDELVDILDASGNPTGRTCLKSEAHFKGLFHSTVHVWFYTDKEQLLFQQRSKDKDTFPSLWDVSVAGHIGAGEEITLAAVREVEEEIGLSVKPPSLEKIGIFKSVHQHSSILKDCEFHHTYICELKTSIDGLILQESEVDNLKLVSIKDFKERVAQNRMDGFVPHKKSYYLEVLDAISKKLKT
ncbi:NUDIX domain-containing protein [uncultured Allomuricauda sp.]|uniref:NUDIX hydrolase n=1 Tax=Flagellimonas sp. W118 TaxID=3410791 RepID=UPI00260835B6|nr:NUDIX domain-containing protein [uncultured Allomuricauda sp.]